MARLILASKSPARMMLLKNAGISFEAMPATDRRTRDRGARWLRPGTAPPRSRWLLPEAKALAVSRSEPAATVIGADQTLEADGDRWTQAGFSTEAGAAATGKASGRTHALHSGVAIARNGEIVWQISIRRASPSERSRRTSSRLIWRDRRRRAGKRRRVPSGRIGHPALRPDRGRLLSPSSECRSCRFWAGCARRR